MNRNAFFTIIFSALVLFGCSSTGSVGGLREKSMQISPGTTKQEVLALLGTPGDRSFKGKAEAWQYCSTGFSQDQYMTIWLFEDVVHGMTSYTRGDAFGVCTQTFTGVDWGQAPDDLKIKISVDE